MLGLGFGLGLHHKYISSLKVRVRARARARVRFGLIRVSVVNLQGYNYRCLLYNTKANTTDIVFISTTARMTSTLLSKFCELIGIELAQETP